MEFVSITHTSAKKMPMNDTFQKLILRDREILLEPKQGGGCNRGTSTVATTALEKAPMMELFGEWAGMSLVVFVMRVPHDTDD